MEIAELNRKTGRIDSLQALRALAFLGIFFSHSKFFISWPKLGVSVFYVMSGFLMTYRYDQVNLDASVKNNIGFSLKKIKKLYPLHIITMTFAIILYIANLIHRGILVHGELGNKAAVVLAEKIALNVTLLQAWAPNIYINISLNGVAWYLSVTMFLYFMFPWIKKIIERNTINKLCIICGLLLVLEVIACVPFIIYLGNDSPRYIWFMYCFPVFRLGDFFIGCVLKRIYFESNISKISTVKATFCEIIATAATVAVFLWLRKEQKNVILLSLHNWTTLYIPLAAVWVALFAANKGLITRALTNRIFIFIGNISAYAFLIHYVVTQYTNNLLLYFGVNVTGWNRAALVFIELVVSLALSVFYKKIHDVK